MNSLKLSLSNLFMFVLVIIFNFLAGTGRINDLSQADISKMYPTKITPAPFAFSIWGVIYTLVFILIIYMIYKHTDREVSEVIHKTAWWFNLSALANILWTVVFSYLKLPLSTLLIVILMLSLAVIVGNLSKTNSKPKPIFSLTFGLYTGWVMIATVVNLAAALIQVNWNRFGLSEITWANIILVVAMVIVFYVTMKTTNAIIPIPVAWAYFAIYKERDLSIALIGTLVLLAIFLYQLYKNKYSLQRTQNNSFESA